MKAIIKQVLLIEYFCDSCGSGEHEFIDDDSKSFIDCKFTCENCNAINIVESEEIK